MRFSSLSLMLCCVVLAGCAATTGTQLAAQSAADLSATQICCKSLADAKLWSLPLEKQQVVIDKTRQAFSFDSGKSFFVLYELPQFGQAYSIVLTSRPGGTMADASIFVPRVSLFDADFKQVRHFDEKSLRSRGSELERTVFINPSNANERYILIYASDLAVPMERVVSVVTSSSNGVGGNWTSGGDVKVKLRPAATGSLEIEVLGLKKK